MKEPGLGIGIIDDLTISESPDFEVIKDNSYDTIMAFKENYCKTLRNLISVIENIIPNINSEISRNFFERRKKELLLCLDRALSNDMERYFEDIKNKPYLDPYQIIKDFNYSTIAELLSKVYRRYNSCKYKKDIDTDTCLFLFNAFKVAAYNLGIRSYDADTLKGDILYDTKTSYGFDEQTISDEDFNDNYDNDSGMQVESIPYYVTLSTIHPTGKKTERHNIFKGIVLYSQSKFNQLTKKVNDKPLVEDHAISQSKLPKAINYYNTLFVAPDVAQNYNLNGYRVRLQFKDSNGNYKEGTYLDIPSDLLNRTSIKSDMNNRHEVYAIKDITIDEKKPYFINVVSDQNGKRYCILSKNELIKYGLLKYAKKCTIEDTYGIDSVWVLELTPFTEVSYKYFAKEIYPIFVNSYTIIKIFGQDDDNIKPMSR